MSADPQPTDRCTEQPISWLALEQHALGELPPVEAAAITDHLRGCPACQACAARITADGERVRLPDLPPLPAIPPLRPRLVPPAARPKWWRWSVGATTGAALAVAAVVLLVGRVGDSPRTRGGSAKGMAVSLTLVRERSGTIAEDPPGFLPGDRWQALITCPAGPPTGLGASAIPKQRPRPAHRRRHRPRLRQPHRPARRIPPDRIRPGQHLLPGRHRRRRHPPWSRRRSRTVRRRLRARGG